MTDYQQDAKAATMGCGCMAFCMAVLTALILMLAGCKTVEVTKEVPVVAEHTTMQRHTDIVRDTLLMRDSVYHYVQGDTVIIERWHQAININRVAVADTIRDTIPQVVTVTETRVERVNELLWHQKALMWLGGVVLFGLILIGFNKLHSLRFVKYK